MAQTTSNDLTAFDQIELSHEFTDRMDYVWVDKICFTKSIIPGIYMISYQGNVGIPTPTKKAVAVFKSYLDRGYGIENSKINPKVN